VPVAGLTALAALSHGQPLLGRRVLITGAAGGVGRFGVQIARLQGAGSVTSLVRNAERGAGLAALGAAVVMELSADGEEFDVIMESVGGPTLAAALGRLASGGTLISIGGSSDSLTTFDGLAFARKGPITMYGMSLFRELERQGMGSRELSDLLALVAAGRLDPQIDRVASWREMGSLLRALGNREINGKAVALID
jgi:NADPH:quinone reductase-like Zn-dependent oxidoreductase